MTVAIIVLALILDTWLGEPRRGHPLIAFGHAAKWLDDRLNHASHSPLRRRLAGALAVALVVVAAGVGTWLLTRLPGLGVAVEVVLLFLCLGGSSLALHARKVARPLAAGHLVPARRRLAHIVSRDTAELDEHGVAGATVESVLENGNDAIFATLFWFVVAGAPGTVIHRLVNTLDAMWGYRTPRYRYFGWAAARLDDALGYIPARLTALSYGLAGRLRGAWQCWRTQAKSWDSPNAGPVMAAGAGALGIRIGGPNDYHGELRERPWLGEGRAAKAFDIERALALVKRAVGVWLLVLLAGGWLLA
ncbi:cobalamin biosynthesis protein [Alkalilimnicola ehrlichii]|uniref:Cobalamin biosynthesis protein CobD n=1 Tax=Alkalilimnicola ehrlichii TaxID=351052 RepID=A0A3E0WLW0_9GAMM|nr:cobalamin biosynthesis protein [Alkalilimnicola ehrlichii]RFA33944.1 cobalamin biosynthesis protein [Alkalilimnicola ehrlichii]